MIKNFSLPPAGPNWHRINVFLPDEHRGDFATLSFVDPISGRKVEAGELDAAACRRLSYIFQQAADLISGVTVAADEEGYAIEVAA